MFLAHKPSGYSDQFLRRLLCRYADEYANRENRGEWGQGLEDYQEDQGDKQTNTLTNGPKPNSKHVHAAAAK